MTNGIKLAINWFKDYNITSVEDARLHWITCKLLGKGVFRKAYRVNKLPLVAKFPKNDKLEINIKHTCDEMATFRRIKKSPKLSKLFKKHLPKIYYFNKDTGVLLMKEYQIPDWGKEFHKKYIKLRTKLDKHLGYFDADPDQFAVDEKGSLIVIDWGLIGDELIKWNSGGYLCL